MTIALYRNEVNDAYLLVYIVVLYIHMYADVDMLATDHSDQSYLKACVNVQ